MPGTPLAFGPIPSRRLGRSLGINNVPFKHCSYSCIYCQLGRTETPITNRRSFHDPEDVVKAVTNRVELLRQRDEHIDYLTIVPDGEPTLDISLGLLIEGLRPLKIPIAVISNGSLLSQESVRNDLGRADWVSIKVDTTDEEVWRALNRPESSLALGPHLDGVRAFAHSFGGTLVTETMLISGVNDDLAAISDTARFIAELDPETAYLNTPVRPTALPNYHAPSPLHLMAVANAFSKEFPRVELIPESEDLELSATGNFEDDVLGIAAVHPIRERELRTLVAKTDTTWEAVDSLVRSGRLSVVEHNGVRFYVARTSEPGGH